MKYVDEYRSEGVARWLGRVGNRLLGGVVKRFRHGQPLDLVPALVGFRNDTNQVISVQTTLELPNGVVKRGKPQMLYPGEVAIDGLIGTGTRRITVSDPKKPNAAAMCDEKKLLSDDTFYSVQLETVMNVKNAPPKVKLVAVVLPANVAKPGNRPAMPPKPPTGQPKKP